MKKKKKKPCSDTLIPCPFRICSASWFLSVLNWRTIDRSQEVKFQTFPDVLEGFLCILSIHSNPQHFHHSLFLNSQSDNSSISTLYGFDTCSVFSQCFPCKFINSQSWWLGKGTPALGPVVTWWWGVGGGKPSLAPWAGLCLSESLCLLTVNFTGVSQLFVSYFR